MHCNSGDKPTVFFTPKLSNQRGEYKSDKAPIEVSEEKESVGSYAKYNARGMTLTFANGSKATYVNYRLDNTGQNIQFWSCGANDWDNRQPDGTYPVFYPLSNGAITNIDRTKGCPPPYPTGEECVLKVRYQGEIIFSTKINCGSGYDVACNGKCKPGEIECPKPGYPGYCCISCQGTASRISNLGAKIRG
jgi:hypothetical protein